MTEQPSTDLVKHADVITLTHPGSDLVVTARRDTVAMYVSQGWRRADPSSTPATRPPQ